MSKSDKPLQTVVYERPVEAKLVVRLDNGEEWEATELDLAEFRLIRINEAYMRFSRALRFFLRSGGELPTDDLTDALLNPIRYFAEVAILDADRVYSSDYEGWPEVVALERVLRDRAEAFKEAEWS